MTKFTQHPIDKSKTKKLFTYIMLLACFAPLLINSVVLAPLYTVMRADVAIPDWVILMVDLLMDILDTIAYSVPFAIIIFSMLLVGRQQSKNIVWMYTVFLLVQIPIKLFMNIPISGSLGSADQIIVDVIYLLVYFIFFMLQLCAVYLFAATDSQKYIQHLEFMSKKSSKKKGCAVSNSDQYALPFVKLYSRTNPLQRSALKMGLLILAIKVLARMLNDITYGLPQSFGEILIMIIYYLSDIFYGVVAYFIALTVFYFIYEKAKCEKEADEENSSSADII